MAKRPLRKTNRTVLIVVEGETEQAFVLHLKNLYYQRGMRLSVSIKNAYGYGPAGVIDKLQSVTATAAFDHRIAVLDADIALTTPQRQWLQQAKVQTITSIPAIEATLLNILGEPSPDITEKCKKALLKKAAGIPTEIRYYEKHFPWDILEAARSKVPVLQALIAAVSTA